VDANLNKWQTVKPKWVLANEDKLKKEGFRIQAAARFLVKRLGYNIIKGEQEIAGQNQVAILESKVGSHLARYSDYIVKKGRHVFVIEVKAKEYSSYLIDSEKVLMFNNSIFLRRNYVDTIASVIVLAILYPRGLFERSSMHRKKAYYVLKSTEGSPTAEGGVEITLAQDPQSYRWIQANTLRRWIKESKRDAEALVQMHSN
jgi:hypothetical protein